MQERCQTLTESLQKETTEKQQLRTKIQQLTVELSTRTRRSDERIHNLEIALANTSQLHETRVCEVAELAQQKAILQEEIRSISHAVRIHITWC